MIAIETENPAGARYAERVKRFTANLYDDYLRYVMAAGDAGKNTITDLGASHYVPFIDNMSESGGLNLIDFLIVVTDAQERSQQDAIATILTFFNLGLDPARLRVIFNKAATPKPEMPIERQYEALFAMSHLDQRIKLNPNCYMPKLPIFDLMAF